MIPEVESTVKNCLALSPTTLRTRDIASHACGWNATAYETGNEIGHEIWVDHGDV